MSVVGMILATFNQTEVIERNLAELKLKYHWIILCKLIVLLLLEKWGQSVKFYPFHGIVKAFPKRSVFKKSICKF